MRNILLFILILLLGLSLFSCKKDKENNPPSITLLTGGDYTPDGSVIAIGGKLKFGIEVHESGTNITNLVIKKLMPNSSETVVFDSGMNSAGFTVNKVFYQSVEDTAQWTFQVMDHNRMFATTSLTIYKNPNSQWGGILEYSSITLGHQDNTEYGHFLIPSSGKVIFTDSAEIYQDAIDIAAYYFVDDLPSPTFSSPGEYGGGIFDYYPFIQHWTTKNYTKWDVSVDGDPISSTAYEACHNDSLLILSYDDVWGKRKFKWSEPGDIIPFLTSGGKKGLIKVITADADPAGKIVFSMKIQR